MVLNTSHAGHGGVDPGAVGNGHKEADIARLYNNDLVALTGARNATDDSATSVNDNLSKITRNVNQGAKNSDWHVSIHLNAATPAATGVEVFADGSDKEAMAKAAEISAKLAKIYGIPNRGAKDGSGLYVIRNTVGHMLLIELGFISNANDVAQVLNKRPQAVKAIAESFGYSTGTPAPTPPIGPSKPSSYYPVGSIIVPKDNPKGMSYYVVAIGSLGYVYANKVQWEDSTAFSTDVNKVIVGSVVQRKNSPFSYVVVNLRKYADGRTEYLIATETRDIAFDAVK